MYMQNTSQVSPTTPIPAIDRLLVALENGAVLTPKQISARFRVKNPRDLIYRLRNDGFRIDTFQTTDTKKVTRTKYRLSRNTFA